MKKIYTLGLFFIIVLNISCLSSEDDKIPENSLGTTSSEETLDSLNSPDIEVKPTNNNNSQNSCIDEHGICSCPEGCGSPIVYPEKQSADIQEETAEEPKKSRLLQPEDLIYEGAFLFPQGTQGGSRWGYGAYALTFYPQGDPNGNDDGHPGSLFGSSHVYDNLVGEASIPAPIISLNKNIKDLPRATQLQNFADITGGLKDTVMADDLDVFGGLLYAPWDNLIYWSFFQYYSVQPLNENDYATHGRSQLTIAHPQAQGIWHIGPYGDPLYHQKKTANYMLEIPKAWADEYVPGKYIGTGKANGAGNAGNSHGPALFAVLPPPADSNLANTTELSSNVLLYYPPNNGAEYFPEWSACDVWEGAVWIESQEKSAVLFAGRKALGEDCYGTPEACNDPCDSGKGYHCYPYAAEFFLYDPAELALVAEGKKETQEVLPYATFAITDVFFPICSYTMGAATFDKRQGLLYVVQSNGEDPIVHVWNIKASE